MPAGEPSFAKLSEPGKPTTLPRRIVLTGFMGAGKSTVGVRLAEELGWLFVDLDEEIVRAERKSIAEIFALAGESRFREMEHRALSDAIRRDGLVLALGGGAVETGANLQMLTSDAETLLLYLEAPLELLIARCEQQQKTESEAARRPVLEQKAELTGRFARRKPLYERAHWTIQTSNCTQEDIVKLILSQWKKYTGQPL